MIISGYDKFRRASRPHRGLGHGLCLCCPVNRKLEKRYMRRKGRHLLKKLLRNEN